MAEPAESGDTVVEKLAWNIRAEAGNIAVFGCGYRNVSPGEIADLASDFASLQFSKRPLKNTKRREVAARESFNLAGPTGLEPATSGVTGRRSNQLNYDPAVGLPATPLGWVAFPGSGAS